MNAYKRNMDIENDAEKRAHHNALERKRRDTLKESFAHLRDVVHRSEGGTRAISRREILKHTSDFVINMTNKITTEENTVEKLNRQNGQLLDQIQMLNRRLESGEVFAEEDLALLSTL
ncbi:hypothetical protein HCN44_007356 [Aphidius gifuensis]|uniref:BHLH domain-containing protein n=1 Tax=Aphidius gifuensis TaxID=684658 RepID=A0A834XN46_APHGI|nr:protein max-like [Aphidius gifuensis]KAF7989046.1 hypothetical protein HCN44_007356 [Aphidius gifuensis]